MSETMSMVAEPAATAAAAQERILLNYQRAAKALNIGQRTLSDLVTTGKIPVVRIGARVLFHPATLDAWAKSRESASAIAPASK